MINDISLAANQWHDIYAASGFGVGTALVIYNKGASNCVIWEGDSAPVNSDGTPLGLDEPITVSDGAPGAWIRSMAPIKINVQELTL